MSSAGPRNIEKLRNDPLLVPRNAREWQKSALRGFIDIRVRNILRSDPSLCSPTDPNDVADNKLQQVRTLLATEMATINHVAWIVMDRLNASARHLHLDQEVDARLRTRYSYVIGTIKPTVGDLEQLRRRMMFSIICRALADNPALNATTVGEEIRKLGFLLDRRLRMAERMLYHVGEGGEPIWPPPSNIQGPWNDGWDRIFEYPPTTTNPRFIDLCNPDPQDAHCQASGMDGWVQAEDYQPETNQAEDYLFHRCQVNPGVRHCWDGPRSAAAYYEFYFKKTAGDPVQAIENLFTKSPDFMRRNFLFCDQVMQCLHLEALVFALKLHFDTSSFSDLVSRQEEGWLRIASPWDAGDTYLISSNESQYFETKTIHICELQIGDHLIIFNHPVYSCILPKGNWHNENVVVVQLEPKILVQGHGIAPKTIQEMQTHLMKETEWALEDIWGRVETLVATVPESRWPGSLPIANTSEPKYKTWVQRRPEIPVARDEFSPLARAGEWWLRWDLHPARNRAEFKLAGDSIRISQEWQRCKIWYSFRQSNNGEVEGTAYFPLFEPQLQNHRPNLDNQGRVRKVARVQLTTDMLTLAEPHSPRHLVRVIRPRI